MLTDGQKEFGLDKEDTPEIQRVKKKYADFSTTFEYWEKVIGVETPNGSPLTDKIKRQYIDILIGLSKHLEDVKNNCSSNEDLELKEFKIKVLEEAIDKTVYSQFLAVKGIGEEYYK